jgi:hypothetical protein
MVVGMKRLQGTLWEGVALRRTRAGADADAAPRPVALPASWEEGAAEALAAIAGPGAAPVSLPRAAEAWIGRATARGLKSGTLADAEEAHRLAEGLRALLLTRRGTLGAASWRAEGRSGAEARFVLSLPAFLEAEGGFDAEGFAEACRIGVRTLDALACARATRLRMGFADLAGLLAGIGLAYDSQPAREVAAAVAALARGAAEAESGRLAARLGAREPLALLWPTPPESTVLPGLAEAARAALDAAAASPQGLRHAGLLVLTPPDAAEALLGAETGGIAPAAGPTRSLPGPRGGAMEVPTRAALRVGAPDAVARLLAPADSAARRAMREAVAPFLHAPPPAPAALPEASQGRAAARRVAAALVPLPALTAIVGGVRVALHRAEDPEGRLVEIGFTLPREAAAAGGLLDGIAAAVSVGLAQGVPLSAFVETFAYARIGAPGGPVEGDDAIRRASSVVDWAFRRLGLEHLGRQDLVDPAEEAVAARPAAAAAAAPLLPLELPQQPFRGRASAEARGAAEAPGMMPGGGGAAIPALAAAAARAGGGRRRGRGLRLAG